jgi:ubiquinone/menaquinone biosynthesis C-methylase UbiE
MSEATVAFDNAAAYDRFMGRWSRAIGTIFLDWLAAPKGARWLDLGCGTGVFTEMVVNTCAPASVVAVDPAAAQIDYARKLPLAQHADFRVADAQKLPFADGAFDVVASALVINFIPNRPAALTEMRRVCTAGGLVAGYVWDFPAERMSSWPLVRCLRDLGIEVPRVPGADDSELEHLQALFRNAGFEEIATKPIEVTAGFVDFDDFWEAQTPPVSPFAKTIAVLPEVRRQDLMEAVRRMLPAAADGSIAYSARANAVKARVPS